jgi:hypothetical protein
MRVILSFCTFAAAVTYCVIVMHVIGLINVAISPLSLKAVKDAGYERMTQVQEATLPVILQGDQICKTLLLNDLVPIYWGPGTNMKSFLFAGKDVLAKAKTGTGKTVGFLVFISLQPTNKFDCHSSFLNYCSDTTTGLTHLTEFTFSFQPSKFSLHYLVQHL